MRVVVDTNIFISALLTDGTEPARLLTLWRAGGFDIVTSRRQVDELMRVTRYPKTRARLEPALAGRLINELRELAVLVPDRAILPVSPDPYDDYLLAIAATGRANFLVTGDKRDLLGLGVYAGSKIVSVRDFMRGWH